MSSALRIFVPIAIRAFINGIVPRIEAAASASVSQLVDLNPAIPERIASGGGFDHGLTNPCHAAALITDGHADSDTLRPFGRVPLAIGRKAGTDAGVTRDVDEVSALLSKANSIACTGAGTSGRTYFEIVKRLGLDRCVLPKSQALGGR